MPLQLVMEWLQQICSISSLSQIKLILDNLFEQNNAYSELLALNGKMQYTSENGDTCIIYVKSYLQPK